jgi:MFS family permease
MPACCDSRFDARHVARRNCFRYWRWQRPHDDHGDDIAKHSTDEGATRPAPQRHRARLGQFSDALTSWPLGSLSDRVGRKPIIAGGWLVYALVYLGFATTSSSSAPWALLAIYGLYQALTEGVTKAMIGDVVGKDQRAGAIGLFYTVSGFGQLIASILAGLLWNVRVWHGQLMTAFLIGTGCAILAAALLATVRADRRHVPGPPASATV